MDALMRGYAMRVKIEREGEIWRNVTAMRTRRVISSVYEGGWVDWSERLGGEAEAKRTNRAGWGKGSYVRAEVTNTTNKWWWRRGEAYNNEQ